MTLHLRRALSACKMLGKQTTNAPITMDGITQRDPKRKAKGWNGKATATARFRYENGN